MHEAAELNHGHDCVGMFGILQCLLLCMVTIEIRDFAGDQDHDANRNHSCSKNNSLLCLKALRNDTNHQF